MSQSESLLGSSVHRWLGSRSWCRLWRNNTGTFRTLTGNRIVKAGLPGSADYLGVLRGGAFVAVETKFKTKQSPEQIAFQRAIEAQGGIYILVRSLEDLKAELKRRGYTDGEDR